MATSISILLLLIFVPFILFIVLFVWWGLITIVKELFGGGDND